MSACQSRVAALLLLAGAQVHAAGIADIAVEIKPDRQASVREHFSNAKSDEFVFLISPCARVGNLRVGGVPETIPAGSGPWITLQGGVDVSYDAAPVSPRPQSCAVPLLMPKMVLDSVSLIVQDFGTDPASVTLPHMIRDGTRWTATLPAVPSKVELGWSQGTAPLASPPLETGLFFWNFWGLVTILVTWTIAYILWAQLWARRKT